MFVCALLLFLVGMDDAQPRSDGVGVLVTWGPAPQAGSFCLCKQHLQFRCSFW